MDFSSHPVVVEYAVRECFKHRTPITAARTTKKNLAGFTNLFIGGGIEIVEIDENILEEQIWLRIRDACKDSISRIKPGMEMFGIKGTLQHFGQKPTQKNIDILISLLNQG